jgi:hypothetical protein
MEHGSAELRYTAAALTVVAFATAMAYLESAVVVYLQRALAVTPEQFFPLRGPDVVGNLAGIEVGREFATLVMLGAIGFMVGRSWVERLAWSAVAFGVWDIFYYVWLWIFIGWPNSPSSWDVLFLIPVPWIGPVWAPIAVSAALVGFGLEGARRVRADVSMVVARPDVAAAVAGGVLVVASFVADAPWIMSGGLPRWYPWPLFLAGLGVAIAGAIRALRRA